MSTHYLFLGDSITDSDRLWTEDYQGLGNGYVYKLWQRIKDHTSVSFQNKGFSALSASGLLERIQRGTIDLPVSDRIFLQIGINDIGISMNTGRSLLEQNFPHIYDSLIQLLLPYGNLVCLSPFLFSQPAFYQSWKNELHNAIHCIESLAERYQIPFCPLQDYFTEMEAVYGSETLSLDGIHLTDFGHELLSDYLFPFLTSKDLSASLSDMHNK